MSNSAESLERLSYAVASLNDDALGMHELIQKGTSSLEKTIEIERQASKDLEESNKAMREMIDLIPAWLASIDETNRSARDSFKSFEGQCLREARENRIGIQTDVFNHQAAISARISSLENELISFKNSTQGFEERVAQAKAEAKASMRPLLFIGIGILVLEAVSIVVSVLI